MGGRAVRGRCCDQPEYAAYLDRGSPRDGRVLRLVSVGRLMAVQVPGSESSRRRSRGDRPTSQPINIVTESLPLINDIASEALVHQSFGFSLIISGGVEQSARSASEKRRRRTCVVFTRATRGPRANTLATAAARRERSRHHESARTLDPSWLDAYIR